MPRPRAAPITPSRTRTLRGSRFTCETAIASRVRLGEITKAFSGLRPVRRRSGGGMRERGRLVRSGRSPARAGRGVTLYAREAETVEDINTRRENRQRLPGIRLDAAIVATGGTEVELANR